MSSTLTESTGTRQLMTDTESKDASNDAPDTTVIDNAEPLPQALPLASPERSATDEDQFYVRKVFLFLTSVLKVGSCKSNLARFFIFLLWGPALTGTLLIIQRKSGLEEKYL